MVKEGDISGTWLIESGYLHAVFFLWSMMICS